MCRSVKMTKLQKRYIVFYLLLFINEYVASQSQKANTLQQMGQVVHQVAHY